MYRLGSACPMKYLPTLDGWRAVAITAVVLCHAFGGTSNSLILNLGQQGVSLFFAISGFLITTLLLDEEKRGRISLRGFYTRRVFRILPAAYLYLAVISALGAFGLLRLGPGEIASAALVYNNYWPSRSWFTQHFWSLSMEEHFYLLWPFVLAICGYVWSRGIAVVGICVTLIWRAWSLGHIHLDVPALQRTDMRLDAFLWACLVAMAVYQRGRLWEIIARKGFHLSVLATVAVIYAIALAQPMQLTKLALQSALLPLVIVPTVFLPNYWISRMLESAPLRWLGRISYGVYLWQQLIFPENGASMRSAAAWFPLKVAFLLSLTAASYKWIERPLIEYGRSRAQESSRRKTPVIMVK